MTSARRGLVILPLMVIVALFLALVGADRAIEGQLGALNEALGAERIGIETVTGIRRDTRKTYVTLLEQRVEAQAEPSVPRTPVTALGKLVAAARAFSASAISSPAERQLRIQLLDAVSGWSQIPEHGSQPGPASSVQSLRDRMREVDRLAEAILKLNSDGARRDEAKAVTLRRQRDGIQVGIAALMLASAVVVLVWRLRSRARDRLEKMEQARKEQEQINATLERAVAERTDDLRRVNDELHCQTAELTVASVKLANEMQARLTVEVELRQAQKLEAVGRLASGVAHEINTPVQFVSDSVHYVRDSVKDILVLVEKLVLVQRAVLAGEPSQEAATQAAQAEEAADLQYVSENLPKALNHALDGLGRITTIVRSMKEFAHPNQKEMAAVDLNRAIQSTLTVASNEYKYVAELETDLGELPPVLCHLGDVNQVVLNIVVNAAHAIGDVVRGTDHKGLIRVTTRRDGDDVVISIADTGSGIPEDVRGRVFDPFFTTKEVGKGTGQGLSIARSVVVEKHLGQLTFDSEMGKGTTFCIRLPIDGPPPLLPGSAPASPAEGRKWAAVTR